MHVDTSIQADGRVVYKAPCPINARALLQLMVGRFGPRLVVAWGRQGCTAALPGRFRLSVGGRTLLLTLSPCASESTHELDILAIGDAVEAMLPRFREAA